MGRKPVMTIHISQEGNRITTSIKINPKILLEAKHFALDKKMTFSQLIEEALKKEIEKNHSRK